MHFIATTGFGEGDAQATGACRGARRVRHSGFRPTSAASRSVCTDRFLPGRVVPDAGQIRCPGIGKASCPLR